MGLAEHALLGVREHHLLAQVRQAVLPLRVVQKSYGHALRYAGQINGLQKGDDIVGLAREALALRRPDQALRQRGQVLERL